MPIGTLGTRRRRKPIPNLTPRAATDEVWAPSGMQAETTGPLPIPDDINIDFPQPGTQFDEFWPIWDAQWDDYMLTASVHRRVDHFFA